MWFTFSFFLRLAQVEKDILIREEELKTLARTSRCLSCGQYPRELLQIANFSVHEFSQSRSSSPNITQYQLIDPESGTSKEIVYSPTIRMPIPVNVNTDVNIVNPFDDEEISVPRDDTDHLSPSPSRPLTEESQRHQLLRRPLTADNSITFEGKFNNSVTSPEQQLSSLLSGTTGLKPLQLQHNPMVPVNRPHTSSMTNYHNKTKQRGTGNVNEGSVPGTGKGKTILSTSLPNPSYMYEGSALENSIHDTIAASGGGMMGSQSLAHIKSNKSSLVLPTKRTSSAEILILPDIHQPSPGNLQQSTYEERPLSSKPSSPTVSDHNDRGMLLTTPSGATGGKKGKAPLGNNSITKDPLIVISQMKIAAHPRSHTMN
jgi:hypothetical protein